MSRQPDTEPEEDESVCIDGYPEHVEVVDYQGDDGTQWHCSRCGAEGWEDAEEGAITDEAQ